MGTESPRHCASSSRCSCRPRWLTAGWRCREVVRAGWLGGSAPRHDLVEPNALRLWARIGHAAIGRGRRRPADRSEAGMDRAWRRGENPVVPEPESSGREAEADPPARQARSRARSRGTAGSVRRCAHRLCLAPSVDAPHQLGSALAPGPQSQLAEKLLRRRARPRPDRARSPARCSVRFVLATPLRDQHPHRLRFVHRSTRRFR
jgi:hypothetical protein